MERQFCLLIIFCTFVLLMLIASSNKLLESNSMGVLVNFRREMVSAELGRYEHCFCDFVSILLKPPVYWIVVLSSFFHYTNI